MSLKKKNRKIFHPKTRTVNLFFILLLIKSVEGFSHFEFLSSVPGMISQKRKTTKLFFQSVSPPPHTQAR